MMIMMIFTFDVQGDKKKQTHDMTSRVRNLATLLVLAMRTLWDGVAPYHVTAMTVTIVRTVIVK